MEIKEIVTLVGGIIAGGGIAGLITAFVQKRKASSDIATTNIETAMKLRDSAIKEYASVEEKLRLVKVLLDEVQGQLDIAKEYIDTLCDILDENEISYPPKPDEVYNIRKERGSDGEYNPKTA